MYFRERPLLLSTPLRGRGWVISFLYHRDIIFLDFAIVTVTFVFIISFTVTYR
jgi:hypothetical protein